MNIRIEPLTMEEKNVIKRAFRRRLILFFIILLPVVLGILYVVYGLLRSFYHHDYDIVSLVALVFFPVMLFIMGRIFIPLNRDSYRNLKATEKQVVTTKVLYEKHWFTRRGYHYLVKTEFKSLDSWKNVILMPGYSFADMETGRTVTIHFIHNNKLDILRIEK